jgi:hypothetical protein
MGLKATGRETMDVIHKIQWWSLMNTVMSLRVPCPVNFFVLVKVYTRKAAPAE